MLPQCTLPLMRALSSDALAMSLNVVHAAQLTRCSPHSRCTNYACRRTVVPIRGEHRRKRNYSTQWRALIKHTVVCSIKDHPHDQSDHNHHTAQNDPTQCLQWLALFCKIIICSMFAAHLKGYARPCTRVGSTVFLKSSTRMVLIAFLIVHASASLAFLSSPVMPHSRPSQLRARRSRQGAHSPRMSAGDTCVCC